MAKRIKVVHAEGGIPKNLEKVFPSYAALMRKMKIGTEVTVAVYERDKVLGDMLMGYGYVERISLTSYTTPRRLMHDY